MAETEAVHPHPVACDTPAAERHCCLPAGSLRFARMTGTGPEFFRTPTGGVRYLYTSLDAWLAALPKSTTAAKRKRSTRERAEQATAA